jgi:poly(3-hydroxyalkanoate) synthetase
MNNPMQFINVLKGIRNPKQAVLDMTKANNSPVFKNLVQMAENNDLQGIEQFARNILKEQGRNFDEEYSQIMNLFK